MYYIKNRKFERYIAKKIRFEDIQLEDQDLENKKMVI